MEKRPTTMSMSVRGEMEKLSVEQLKAMKEQTDLEVNLLNDSLNNIRTATTRLELTSSALHDLSLRPSGKKMLVPITASLYVPRTLQDPDQVLVDVGTGYFIEKNMPQAKDYCDRKISLLKSNFEQLVKQPKKELWLGNLRPNSIASIGAVGGGEGGGAVADDDDDAFDMFGDDEPAAAAEPGLENNGGGLGNDYVFDDASGYYYSHNLGAPEAAAAAVN
ncbi:hypothetical protein ACLB2K_029482 [Fragaria x ananassa]